MLGAVEREVDVEREGGGDGEGEVGHRGHQVHPARPREVLFNSSIVLSYIVQKFNSCIKYCYKNRENEDKTEVHSAKVLPFLIF